jgi:hypothetical protein
MTSPSAQELAETEVQTLSLTSLPTPLSHRIFLLLEVDERARASCVSPDWRDLLDDPALWTRLDLVALQERSYERSSQRFADAVLPGAARRARGQLHRLEVASLNFASLSVPLLEVLAANAGCLRELQVSNVFSSGVAGSLDFFNRALERFTAAAPLLGLLEIKMAHVGWEVASHLMRAGPPSSVTVRLQGLEVDLRGQLDIQPFAAALADAEVQPALAALKIDTRDCQNPTEKDKLLEALLARQTVRSLTLAGHPPAAAPLARLLAGGMLTHLDLGGAFAPWYGDAAGSALVADALRATTLTSLVLWSDQDNWGNSLPTVLGALVGHRSLRKLKFSTSFLHSSCPARLIANAAAVVAAIVAADAPALEALDLSLFSFVDPKMWPILDALPLNHHLRYLDISNGFMGFMRENFVVKLLLPAVRANTGLRKLLCVNKYSNWPASQEAEQLVQRRR